MRTWRKILPVAFAIFLLYLCIIPAGQGEFLGPGLCLCSLHERGGYGSLSADRLGCAVSDGPAVAVGIGRTPCPVGSARDEPGDASVGGAAAFEHSAIYLLDTKAVPAFRPAVCSDSSNESAARAFLYTPAGIPDGFKRTSLYPFRNLDTRIVRGSIPGMDTDRGLGRHVFSGPPPSV